MEFDVEIGEQKFWFAEERPHPSDIRSDCRVFEVAMPDDTYRLNERLRLIGKRLDQQYAMPDMPLRMMETLRRLAEIEVPAKKRKNS